MKTIVSCWEFNKTKNMNAKPNLKIKNETFFQVDSPIIAFINK